MIPNDSGEREATRWTMCVDPTCSEHRQHLAHQLATFVPVAISLDLAQRILAVLNASATWLRWHADYEAERNAAIVAAELRAIVERKTTDQRKGPP